MKRRKERKRRVYESARNKNKRKDSVEVRKKKEKYREGKRKIGGVGGTGVTCPDGAAVDIEFREHFVNIW
jgi:hypothetical protein